MNVRKFQRSVGGKNFGTRKLLIFTNYFLLKLAPFNPIIAVLIQKHGILMSQLLGPISKMAAGGHHPVCFFLVPHG